MSQGANSWPEDWAADQKEVSALAKKLAAYPLKPKCPDALSETDRHIFDLTQKIELLMRAVLDVKKGISHMKRDMDEVSKNFDNLYAKTVGASFKFERMRAEVDKLKEEVLKLQSLGQVSTDSILKLFAREK